MSGILTGLASAIWSTATSLIRLALRWGILKPAKLNVRVISVGNIQVGGAGKTPLVAQIAREAHERGLRACILCRGYGSEWEGKGGVICPEEQGLETALCGDEAVLLHDLAPQAYIGVGANRVRQYEAARSKASARGDLINLVILDDGFQHWKIRKDVEIVAVTSATRTQKLFRDWASAIKIADLVIWTKGEEKPRLPVRSHVRVRYRLPPSRDGREFWLVTGLADGEGAKQSVQAAGYALAKHVRFPDHAKYQEDLAASLVEDARRSGCRIALTGKDWVKWRELRIPRDRIEVLEPELVFEEGKEAWKRLLWGESSSAC